MTPEQEALIQFHNLTMWLARQNFMSGKTNLELKQYVEKDEGLKPIKAALFQIIDHIEQNGI